MQLVLSELGSPDEAPRLIGGRYALRRVVGAGASSEVWLAEDTVLHVPRAIKMLRLDARHRDALRRRMRAEALVMSRLAHPNVLRVYDVGEDHDIDYIVMAWSARGSLGDQLEREGPLRPQAAIGYAIQVLRALQAAHQAGVVHRDVKPPNILLDDHDNALLADFGIALVEDPHSASRHTATGAALGSLAYMAPEQRVDARQVDGRADLYALAATLYVLITRATPIDLFLADVESARWNGVPEPLLPILRRNLNARPADRSSSAQEMASALGEVLAQLTGSAEPTRTLPVWEPAPARGLTAPTLADELVLPTVEDAPPTPPLARAPRLLAATPLVILLGMSAMTAGVLLDGTPAPDAPPVVVAEPRAEAPVPDAPVMAVAAPPASPTAAPERPQPKRASRQDPPASTTPSGPDPCASAWAHVDKGPTPTGTWRGSFGGYPACLVLSGPPQTLEGRIRVQYDGNHVDNELRGRYDEESGLIELADVERRSDSGTYRLRRAPNGEWAGEFEGDRGQRRPIAFEEHRP